MSAIRNLLDKAQQLLDDVDPMSLPYPWQHEELQDAVDAVEEEWYAEQEEKENRKLFTIIYEPTFCFYNLIQWNEVFPRTTANCLEAIASFNDTVQ